MSRNSPPFKRKALLFDSAFDNDRDGCMSALGVSQDVCPIDGDGVFDFPDGTELALAVDTKNAAGATAASEAAVAGGWALCASACEYLDDCNCTLVLRFVLVVVTPCMPWCIVVVVVGINFAVIVAVLVTRFFLCCCLCCCH